MKIDGVELSEDQVEEFKEAFAEFDMNSDGTITTDELGLCSFLTIGDLCCTVLYLLYCTYCTVLYCTVAGLVIRRLEGEFPPEQDLKQMVAEVDQVSTHVLSTCLILH